MKLNQTDIVILRALANHYGPQSVSDLYAVLPPLFSNKRALSSRLCEMRSRNLLTSKTLDSGINEWQAKDSALMMLPDAVAADISDQPNTPIPEPIQLDTPDISPDIIPETHRPIDVIAAELHDAILASNEVVDAELPDFGSNSPICADTETSADALSDGSHRYVEPDISDDLVEEANSLRLRQPLPRLKEALYVLAVLADVIGDRPAMVYELDRISDYLEREAA